MTRYINMPNGHRTLVDEATFNEFGHLNWYVDHGGRSYVVRAFTESGKQKKRYLHRLIAGPREGQQVDHINHNKLDNRGCNLRCVSHTENQRNKSPRKDSSSGHVGVYFIERLGKWRAQIYVGRTVNLGYFSDIESAVTARHAANKLYGYHSNHGLSSGGVL